MGDFWLKEVIFSVCKYMKNRAVSLIILYEIIKSNIYMYYKNKETDKLKYFFILF